MKVRRSWKKSLPFSAPWLKVCRRSDPNLNQCLNDLFVTMFPELAKGKLCLFVKTTLCCNLLQLNINWFRFFFVYGLLLVLHRNQAEKSSRSRFLLLAFYITEKKEQSREIYSLSQEFHYQFTKQLRLSY